MTLPNYTCGYCGQAVVGTYLFTDKNVILLTCPDCREVTFYNKGTLHPPAVGHDIGNLADSVKQAYREARIAFDSESYLACMLICRTVIMYTAVDKGAEEKKGFESYVDYLVDSELITKQMKGFAKKVKDSGNRAAHEIDAPSREAARRTLDFTTKLLRQVYEDVEAEKDDLPVDPEFFNEHGPRPRFS